MLTKENVTPNRSSVNACKAPYWRCLIQFLDGIFNTNTTARQISMHLANAFDERKRNSASTFVIKDYIMNQYKKIVCINSGADVYKREVSKCNVLNLELFSHYFSFVLLRFGRS